MFDVFRQSAEAWQGVRRFQSLPEAQRRIVFCAEDRGAWAYLGPAVTNLATVRGRQLCYLTSSNDDPVLETNNQEILPFFVGEGHLRTFLFQSLDAGILATTMPDLQTFHLKRSRNPVHYLYLHHSIVSTHMIYRPAAFDHRDTIFCVGPHYVAEIRAREALCGLPRKNLVNTGMVGSME